jgi:hypothetical protein
MTQVLNEKLADQFQEKDKKGCVSAAGMPQLRVHSSGRALIAALSRRRSLMRLHSLCLCGAACCRRIKWEYDAADANELVTQILDESQKRIVGASRAPTLPPSRSLALRYCGRHARSGRSGHERKKQWTATAIQAGLPVEFGREQEPADPLLVALLVGSGARGRRMRDCDMDQLQDFHRHYVLRALLRVRSRAPNARGACWRRRERVVVRFGVYHFLAGRAVWLAASV